jgi:hypothetical protein
VAVGEVEPRAEVDDGRRGQLGQADQRVEILGVAAQVVGEDHRPLGRHEPLGRLVERRGVGLQGGGRERPVLVRQRHRRGQWVLLERGVEAEIHGPAGLGHHHAIAAGEGVDHARRVGGLVVPLDELAHGVALHERGVDPVDRRAPARDVHRAGGAQDEHWHAVQVGVVDGHGAVEQAHHVVEDRGHGAAGRLGVAVSDADRDLLVGALDQRRLVVAVVDQRVVQAPKAGARVERHVRDVV